MKSFSNILKLTFLFTVLSIQTSAQKKEHVFRWRINDLDRFVGTYKLQNEQNLDFYNTLDMVIEDYFSLITEEDYIDSKRIDQLLQEFFDGDTNNENGRNELIQVFDIQTVVYGEILQLQQTYKLVLRWYDQEAKRRLNSVTEEISLHTDLEPQLRYICLKLFNKDLESSLSVALDNKEQFKDLEAQQLAVSVDGQLISAISQDETGSFEVQIPSAVLQNTNINDELVFKYQLDGFETLTQPVPVLKLLTQRNSQIRFSRLGGGSFVRGQIVNKKNKGIPGAIVNINLNDNRLGETLSGADGYFELEINSSSRRRSFQLMAEKSKYISEPLPIQVPRNNHDHDVGTYQLQKIRYPLTAYAVPGSYQIRNKQVGVGIGMLGMLIGGVIGTIYFADRTNHFRDEARNANNQSNQDLLNEKADRRRNWMIGVGLTPITLSYAWNLWTLTNR